MLKTLVNFVKILNSEAEPGQISLALGLSMVAGLTPLFSLHNLLVLLLVLLLRVNLSAFLLGLTFFSGLGYALDPLFHRIGLAVLTASPLNGLWTTLYNSTLWRVEQFNNSIVMGSPLMSLLFLVPFYFLANWAILRYRDHVLAWVRKTRLMQVLSAVRWGGDL